MIALSYFYEHQYHSGVKCLANDRDKTPNLILYTNFLNFIPFCPVVQLQFSEGEETLVQEQIFNEELGILGKWSREKK